MDRRAPFPADFQLVLASQSPRRHSMLRDLGVPFTVARSDAEELLEGDSAQGLAERNALVKLQAAALPEDVAPGAFVLATDTIVVADDMIMGKPASAAEAASMLAALSGRTHQVVSGVALGRVSGTVSGVRSAGGAGAGGAGAAAAPTSTEVRSAHAVTDVTFFSLDHADIEAYVASGEWDGKAGAYAIQGIAGLFVSGIRGEYSNVVGLPLGLLGRMFREEGFDLVRRTWL